MFQNGEVLSEERFNIISMKATVEFQVDKFLKDQKADVACQICKSTGKVAAYRGKKTTRPMSVTDVGDETDESPTSLKLDMGLIVKKF